MPETPVKTGFGFADYLLYLNRKAIGAVTFFTNGLDPTPRSRQVPVIAVNTAWNDEARTFTLLHELGHLVARTDSACAAGEPAELSDAWDPVERWCQGFAAALLSPKEALSSDIAHSANRPVGRSQGGRDRQAIQEHSLGRRTTELFRQALAGDVVARAEALTYLDIPDQALDLLGARRTDSFASRDVAVK